MNDVQHIPGTKKLRAAVEAQGPWPQIVTLSKSIDDGETFAIEDFEFTSGSAFSTLTVTKIGRITVINKSGGRLLLIGDSAISNDIEVPLDTDETHSFFTTDASVASVKNSSGGTLVCHAIIEGEFAEVPA